MSQANDDDDDKAGELNERPNKQPSGDQATDSRLYVRSSVRPSRQPESQSSPATTATATTRIVCPKAKAKPSREAPEPQSRSVGPSSGNVATFAAQWDKYNIIVLFLLWEYTNKGQCLWQANKYLKNTILFWVLCWNE